MWWLGHPPADQQTPGAGFFFWIDGIGVNPASRNGYLGLPRENKRHRGQALAYLCQENAVVTFLGPNTSHPYGMQMLRGIADKQNPNFELAHTSESLTKKI